MVFVVYISYFRLFRFIGEFSFFNYPFLFDPIAKNRILHIDAMVQMSQGYEVIKNSNHFVYSMSLFH